MALGLTDFIYRVPTEAAVGGTADTGREAFRERRKELSQG